jgi:hypothetical protein
VPVSRLSGETGSLCCLGFCFLVVWSRYCRNLLAVPVLTRIGSCFVSLQAIAMVRTGLDGCYTRRKLCKGRGGTSGAGLSTRTQIETKI